MIQRMYLVQRVERRRELRNKVNPSVDDRYGMDYMGSAEYEFGSLPKSLKRICKNIDDFVIYTSEKIKDYKGNPLQFFIKKDIIDEYMKEIDEYLEGRRHLKESIGLKYYITGKSFGGQPIDQSAYQIPDIWWDIDNDVWFTFIPKEIENIKTSIQIVRDNKKNENKEGWY